MVQAMDGNTFEKHSWYLRNALVRANYNNRKDGIASTFEFLTCFFVYLLFDGRHELQNRDLHITRSPL
jgi:hypothetical protein